jgi:Ni,Fe-hydrogenase I small subunit
MCIRAGAPCIGCASSLFAAKKNYAMYPREELAEAGRRKLEGGKP